MSEHANYIMASIAADDGVSALAASWRRCHRRYHLAPDWADAPDRSVRELLEGRERDHTLVAVAQPYLDQLFKLLPKDTSGVYLADRTGLMLDLRTNRPFDPFGRRTEDQLGTRYSEELLGTNSVGTCLVEQRNVVVRGGEHFLTCHCHLLCIGAPLFGAEGEIVGCLAVSDDADAYDARLDPFLSMTVATIARRIELELFAKAYPKARLTLAAPITSHPGAVLALDDDNRVMGATYHARRLLGLDDTKLVARPAYDALFDQNGDGGDALADLERRLIERAIARCGGNLSAAAKSIGISRSTLYRKIADIRRRAPLSTSESSTIG